MKAETKYKGAIKLSAIGDALGWITEFVNSEDSLYEKYGVNRIENFYSWEKNVGGRFNGYIDKIKAGSYSDDTQLQLCVARSINGDGTVDNNYFSKIELPTWLKYSRGAGRTIKNAAQKIERKSVKWNNNFFTFKVGNKYVDYRESGANGAAMRILPIVLANFRDINKIKEEVFANSIITHGHSRAILGALVFAYSIDLILPNTPDNFSPENFIVQIGQDFQNKFELPFLNHPTFAEWITEWNKNSNITFIEQYQKTLKETQDLLRYLYKSLASNYQIADTLKQIGCLKNETKGSGISTVLAGIYLTCKFYNNPLDGILYAVNYLGSDTDSIAAFTGTLLGALHGQNIIPKKWLDVQDIDYLEQTALKLLSISENKNHKEEISLNKRIDSFEILNDNLEIEQIIYIEPLGEGIIKAIERQKTITKGKYVLIVDVDFKIGQTCRFSKLISGELPKASNEKEVVELVKNKISDSKHTWIINKIKESNNSELNKLIIEMLKNIR